MQKDANPGSPSNINYSLISVGSLSFHTKKASILHTNETTWQWPDQTTISPLSLYDTHSHRNQVILFLPQTHSLKFSKADQKGRTRSSTGRILNNGLCLAWKQAQIIKLEFVDSEDSDMSMATTRIDFAKPHWTQIKLSLYECSTNPQPARDQPIQILEDLQRANFNPIRSSTERCLSPILSYFHTIDWIQFHSKPNTQENSKRK